MSVYWSTSDVTLHCGDARTVWRDIEPGSAHAIVTSPPYFGLRDYGVDGQLGLEASPGEYVDGLADLLTDWGTSVLREDGSLWLNLGDSYSNTSPASDAPSKTPDGTNQRVRGTPDRSLTRSLDCPPKCLLMIPERVALALIDRGWTLRNRVVWAKPNGMPSSAKDRLATKHEAVFHFVRQPRYHYDLDAIREPHVDTTRGRGAKGLGSTARDAAVGRASGPNAGRAHEAGANPGDVWSIPTQPYPEAHFAVFPPELVRRPILATVPEQACKACGAGRTRVVETGELVPTDPGTKITTTGVAGLRAGDEQSARAARDFATGSRNSMPRRERTHVGWSDCGCGDGWQPGTVADPFAGAGTTAVMARRLGRRSLLCELNADYCDLIAGRLAQGVLL